MAKPLNLREHRNFYLLKEQKYLFKHLMLSQTDIPRSYAKMLIDLVQDCPEYELIRHVDIDLFRFPEPAVL